MPNSVVCPACDTRLKIPDNYAAKAARCPKCRGVVPIVVEMEVIEDEEVERPPPKKKLRRERVRTLILGPGIGLIAFGGLSTLLSIFSFVGWIYRVIVAQSMGPGARIEWGPVFLAFVMILVGAAISAFLLFAGIQMVRLQNYAVSMAGCVILTLVSGCGTLTMLAGSMATTRMPGIGSMMAMKAVVVLIPLFMMAVGVWGFVTLLFESVRRVFS